MPRPRAGPVKHRWSSDATGRTPVRARAPSRRRGHALRLPEEGPVPAPRARPAVGVRAGAGDARHRVGRKGGRSGLYQGERHPEGQRVLRARAEQVHDRREPCELRPAHGELQPAVGVLFDQHLD